MTLPTFEEIEALHKKYASTDNVFDLVFTHSKIVSEIAALLLEAKPQAGIDAEFVRVGCLLHDIGVYTLYKDDALNKGVYITHGVEGYKVLKSEGFEEALCRVASHHTGVGLSKEDIEQEDLPLPNEDFFAQTQEERLIMYADKFHSKTPKFNSFDSYRHQILRFGVSKAEKFDELAEEFGILTLEELSKKYDHPFV